MESKRNQPSNVLPLSRGNRTRKSSTNDERDAVAVGCSGRVGRRPRTVVSVRLAEPDGYSYHLNMPPFNDAARLARMADWAKVIATEVADTLLNHHIFWEVQELIRANPKLVNARSHFFEWMGDVFVSSAASAVRRQIDADKDSVCLRRLLQETKDYAAIVTRAHYLSVCGSPPVGDPLRDINEHAFDQWAGAGGAHIDPALVDRDLDSLQVTCERIRHYVNKRVAHYDKHGVTPTMMPTFQDLDDAYALIESLTQKYHLIFTGVWIGQLRPTIIYPWTDIFTLPWIPPGSREVH